MNTIKKFDFHLIRNIFRITIFTGIFLLITSFDLSDVQYSGRYVNLSANPQRFYDSDFNVTIHVHSSIIYNTPGILPSVNFGSGPSTPAACVTEAANKWNAVIGSYLNFVADISNPPNGYPIKYDEINTGSLASEYNVIGFDKGTNGDFFQGFDPNNQNIDAKTMAYTYRYYYQNNSSCPAWFSPALIGADIIINPHVPWIMLDNEYCSSLSLDYEKYADFQSAVLHELGHAAGIKHHPHSTVSSITDVMDNGQMMGVCRRTLTSLDEFAIERLYGGMDVEQASSIPCSTFVTNSIGDGLKASINPGIPEDPCHCMVGSCCCDKQKAAGAMNISTPAMENMSVFARDEIHYNINKLTSLVVNNRELLTLMITSTSPKYKPVQSALDRCKNINAPLLNATFGGGEPGMDLSIKKANIDAFVDVINLVAAQTNSVEFKKELAKLKTSICSMEGKTIKEAAVKYDKLGFE